MDATIGIWIIIGASILFAVMLSIHHSPPKNVRVANSAPDGYTLSLRPLFGLTGNRAIEKSVHSMRALGFFSHLVGTSDRRIAREISSKIDRDIEALGSSFRGAGRPQGWWTLATAFQQGRASPFEMDVLSIAGEASRVWWKDLDQVGSGQNAYVSMLQQWSEISRGAFNPANIQESWGTPGEPIFVSFSLDGTEHLFVHLTSYDDLLDTVGMREVVNPLIVESGIQFEIVDLHHTPNIVVTLTAGEREQLIQNRGWTFAELPALVI